MSQPHMKKSKPSKSLLKVYFNNEMHQVKVYAHSLTETELRTQIKQVIGIPVSATVKICDEDGDIVFLSDRLPDGTKLHVSFADLRERRRLEMEKEFKSQSTNNWRTWSHCTAGTLKSHLGDHSFRGAGGRPSVVVSPVLPSFGSHYVEVVFSSMCCCVDFGFADATLPIYQIPWRNDKYVTSLESLESSCRVSPGHRSKPKRIGILFNATEKKASLFFVENRHYYQGKTGVDGEYDKARGGGDWKVTSRFRIDLPMPKFARLVLKDVKHDDFTCTVCNYGDLDPRVARVHEKISALPVRKAKSCRS